MNEKISIQEIIEALVVAKNIEKQEAEVFVRSLFDIIREALETDKYIKIKGLGSFKLIEVNSRESVDVNTGERILIEGHTKISFTPDPQIRELVNKPFSFFETVVLNEGTVLDDTLVYEEETDEENDVGEKIARKPIETSLIEEKKEIIPPITVPEAGNRQDKPQQKSAEFLEKPSLEPEQLTEQTEPLADNPEQLTEETEQLTPEPVASSDPEKEKILISPTLEKMDKETKQGLPYFIFVIILVITMLSGILIYIYKPELIFNLLPEQKEKNEVQPDSTEKEPQPQKTTVPMDTLPHTDTLSIQPIPVAKTDIPKNETGQTETKPAPRIETEQKKSVDRKKADLPEKGTSQQEKKTTTKKIPFTPDSTSYSIIGTKTSYTIKEGETLTMVSLKFYGTKGLWPYLVKHNPKVITNPDRVPYGTTIKIPELKAR